MATPTHPKRLTERERAELKRQISRASSARLGAILKATTKPARLTPELEHDTQGADPWDTRCASGRDPLAATRRDPLVSLKRAWRD